MNKKITELRLQKEEQSFQKEPHEQAVVTRQDSLNFHFCLFGLEEDFAKGFYHGVLELPEDYPFSPPKIKFLTENGRFQVGKSICTTFTHYHKETWSSSWNIRTILTGLISFMYTSERGIGGVFDSTSRRKTLAKKSLANNLGNPLFVELFKQKLISRAIVSPKEIQQLIKKKADKEQKRQRKLTKMYEKLAEAEIEISCEYELQRQPQKKIHFEEKGEAENPQSNQNYTVQEEDHQLE